MLKRTYEWESNEEAKKEVDPITDRIVELHKALLTENRKLRVNCEILKQQLLEARTRLKACCGKEEK